MAWIPQIDDSAGARLSRGGSSILVSGGRGTVDPWTWLILLIILILLLLVVDLFRWRPPTHQHDDCPFIRLDITVEAGASTEEPELEEYLLECTTNPPRMFGEELDELDGDKYILLAAGAEVVDFVLVDIGPPVSVPSPIFGYHEVVPKSQAPSSPPPVPPPYDAVGNMANAWAGLVQRYASKPFRDAGWKLVAIRAHEPGDIDAALAEIKDRDPAAVVVHYLGHGNADYSFSSPAAQRATTRPWLSLRGWSRKPFNLPQPDGSVRQQEILVPDEHAETRYYVDDLVQKLNTDFPNIPRIAILDGCELAQSLDLRASLTGMVVAVDCVYCGVNLALFSEIYSSHAAPGDLDDFIDQMSSKLATVNSTLTRYTVPYMDISNGLRIVRWVACVLTSVKKPPQRASLDVYRYP